MENYKNMEINNFNHVGSEAVIENLLIHSMSPHARRLVRELYTCNPYEIDIKLDNEARNRGAEIINTRLKTIGRRLVFKKVPKKRIKLTIDPIRFEKNPIIQPIRFIDKNDVYYQNYDVEEDYKERMKFKKKVANSKKVKRPITFAAIDLERARQRAEDTREVLSRRTMSDREIAEKYQGED